MGIPSAYDEFPKRFFGISARLVLGKGHLVKWILRGPRLWSRTTNVGLEVSVCVRAEWLKSAIKRHLGECIGGHAPYSDILLDMLETQQVRPIQIVRDPRDVIVSFAHWIESEPNWYSHSAFTGLSIPDRMLTLIRGYLHGGLTFDPFGTVMDRSYGWLTRPDRVLVVRFEDLVGPKGGGSRERQLIAIERVTRWLGVENVDYAVVAEQLFGGTPTFRKGRIGSWREEFTSQVKDEFTNVVGPRLEQWGYVDE